MKGKNNLEKKVRIYIKMKRFFVFSDLLMITEASKDSLLRVLKKLIKEKLIRVDSDETIMSCIYIVLPKKKVEQKQNTTTYIDVNYMRQLYKVVRVLESLDKEEIVYLDLQSKTKISKGLFAKCIKDLVALDVMTTEADEFTHKYNLNYKVCKTNNNHLHTFLKQKEYEKVQEILDGKRALKYSLLPDDLPQILETIVENELLKRDELSRLAEVTRKRLSDWWTILKKLGVIVDSYKELNHNRVTYIFSAKRAKSVLKSLDNGAYEKSKELKHLWIQQ